MLEIRIVEPKDFFSIIKLSFETLTEVYSPVIFNSFYEAYPNGFLVAEINRKIIGFIIGIKISKTSAKISMMAVNENYRRKKTGSLLLNKLIVQLIREGITQIDLEVNTNNIAAIQFYKRHGFIISDKILKFYQSGDDAYIMKLILHSG